MKYLLSILPLLFSLHGFGQDYFYLEEVRLKKKTDFIENKHEVIKAVAYLLNTPVDEKNMDRKACTRFIIKYAQKTPFLTMTIDASLSKVYQGNPALLEMYMGLWLKSALNNENKSDAFHEEYAYEQLSQYCANDNGVVKTEIVRSLITAGEKGDINNWILELKK